MKRRTHTIDIHIGLQLRKRRLMLGLSQEELAKKLGLSFQQIQKYEKATNRISAARLYEIAQILRTEITYFYEGFDENMQLNEENISLETYALSLKNKEKPSQRDIIISLIALPPSTKRDQIFTLVKDVLQTHLY